jgi:hypothetical protein
LSSEKPTRRSLAWIVGGIWIATILAVFIARHIHPATTAQVSVSVKEISFRTNASNILGPSGEEQLLVSGVGSLQIQLNSAQKVTTGGPSFQAALIQIEGEPSGSCTFYRVRSDGLNLTVPSIITIGVPSATGTGSFSLKVHGSLRGHLTSQPGEASLKSGFECTRVHLNGASAGNVTRSFSPQGGDSISFITSSDSHLTFDLTANSQIGDTQIPILDEVRFSHIDPRTSQEKTVLLKNKNEVSFDKVGKSVALDESDLLVLVPKKDEFYVSQFTVGDGIHLSMEGVARDVRAGAGATALETLMPSWWDHLDNAKRFYGGVPGLVATILLILGRMGLLPEK